MKSFINAILSYISEKLGFLTKIFGWLSTSIGLQTMASIAFKAFLLIALGAFISYIARLWNLFKDLIIQFKSLGFSASGFSYGISNSQLVSSFWGFVHASGLDDAFITSGTLFISLLSAYFGIQAYKLFYTLFKDGFTMVSNGTKLLPKK